MNQKACRFARSNLLLGVICIGASLLTGCSRREFAEVTGTVTLDGKPLDHVEIQFLPAPDKGNAGPTACAYTDEQGRYRLRCDKEEKEGTVLGPHRVCFVDITVIAGPSGPGEPGAMPKKPKILRVPPRYSRVAETPFQDIEVKPGTQALDFNIVSGKH
jgi:hypothetical protein